MAGWVKQIFLRHPASNNNVEISSASGRLLPVNARRDSRVVKGAAVSAEFNPRNHGPFMKRSKSSESFIARLKSRPDLLAVVSLALAAGVNPSQAQPIAVPNFSFESQSAVGFPQGANPNIDSWQKIAEPAFYTPAFGTFGIPWFGTAGVFVDSNPYGNVVGTQAGYILAVPQVTLFQDYNTSPTHDFDGTFEVGKAYNLTIGVFGKSSIAPGSTLELSLYYRDNLDTASKSDQPSSRTVRLSFRARRH